jgi:hypothetical protein
MNINPWDTERSDSQREDGKMTSEDSYMIRTDLMVYHDFDDYYYYYYSEELLAPAGQECLFLPTFVF